MPAKAYFVAARRSARAQEAATSAPAWHETVMNTPGVTVSGGTEHQLLVQADSAALQRLREALGEGFLIEPVLTRGTTGSGQEEPSGET